MKLHRLEIEGFGPFRARQVVDFDAFEDDGIFLISGRTGSGKSSILDGVCFALFGSVPRYEASEKRIRSDHSTTEDATSVTLEFTAAARRWRLERSPEYERPKARSAGMTTVPHAARIDEWADGEWQTRAARPREVAHLLDEIVGLNQQQFLQVILLAQGRFAQFLLAKNDERQTLLRTLFGTRVYQDYQSAFEERRKSAAHALERGGDGLRMLLAEAHLLIEEHGFGGESITQESIGALPARPEAEIAGVERAVTRAAYRADTLTREADVAEEAHAAAAATLSALTALRARQIDRARSRAALAAFESAEPMVAADRVELARATAAEFLRAPIDAAHRAQSEADRAAQAQRIALAAWVAENEDADAGTAGDHAVDTTELRKLIDELTGALTLWQSAADQEPELRAALTRAAQARRTVEEGESALAQLDAQRDGIPARRAAIDDELTILDGAALALETAHAQEQILHERLTAAHEASKRAEAVRTAERQHSERLDALERATSDVAALLRRRLAGYAGELAQSLVEGEPCAVCGAIEHPLPAPHTAEPVTAEMITDAEGRKASAAARETVAAETARAARAEHGAAAARAGGATPAELESIVVAAAEATEQAGVAARRREELIAVRRELIELEVVVRAEHDALTAHVSGARESVAADEQRSHGLQQTVDAARGEFATVAERIDVASRRRRLARDLAEKSETLALREAAAREAVIDRDARVAASDVADAAEAISALREAAAREQLTARIRRHEVGLAAERDRLRELELELAGEPEELIDLGAIQASVGAARTVWREAEALAARSLHAASQLASLAERLARANAETADLTATHDLVAGVANAVAGRTASRMDLETFVLAAELEEIVTAANLRLDEMSSGRYRLQHSDAVAVRNGASGLGLEVLDAYTGRARPPQSLSGGETFLASLALALGLAEVVTARAGGIRLDTLFVDEGFGSLDAETLDLAMRTLDELRQGGRTVGVISHVEAMKEQLPAQLVVESTPAGPSVIRQDAALHV